MVFSENKALLAKNIRAHAASLRGKTAAKARAVMDDYSRDYMPCPIDFTTFEQDPILMGTTAAELLLERISSPTSAPKRMVFPPVLIEHNSVVLKR